MCGNLTGTRLNERNSIIAAAKAFGCRPKYVNCLPRKVLLAKFFGLQEL